VLIPGHFQYILNKYPKILGAIHTAFKQNIKLIFKRKKNTTGEEAIGI
jgi:hypothetical protein